MRDNTMKKAANQYWSLLRHLNKGRIDTRSAAGIHITFLGVFIWSASLTMMAAAILMTSPDTTERSLSIVNAWKMFFTGVGSTMLGLVLIRLPERHNAENR